MSDVDKNFESKLAGISSRPDFGTENGKLRTGASATSFSKPLTPSRDSLTKKLSMFHPGSSLTQTGCAGGNIWVLLQHIVMPQEGEKRF